MLKGSVLLDDTKWMMMRRRRRSMMITQRHDGPVNLPSLQVVLCTKQKIDKMRIKIFCGSVGTSKRSVKWFVGGSRTVGRQTEIRLPLD